MNAPPEAATARPSRWPHPGDVVAVGRPASVQFDGARGFRFRVIAVTAQSAHAGWMWVDGVQLGPDGDAIRRREIFVRADGLRPAPQAPATGTTTTTTVTA
jgi:hypothetical protein